MVTSRLKLPDEFKIVLRKPTKSRNLDKRIVEIMESVRSPSTVKTYRNDWNRFRKWMESQGMNEYPISVDTLAEYLLYLYDNKYSKTIVNRSLTVISMAHDALDDPTGDRVIRQIKKGIRRLDKRRPKKAAPLGLNSLMAMCECLGLSAKHRDIQDRAILSLGWMGALRSSEIVALQWQDITQVSAGIEVTINQSKTNKENDSEIIAIPLLSDKYRHACAVRNLLATIASEKHSIIGRSNAPIFPSPIDNSKPISTRKIDRAIKHAAQLAGINQVYTTHSLRRGWATFAASQGVSQTALMRHGRWKSSAIAQGYVDHADLWLDNPIAQILGQ